MWNELDAVRQPQQEHGASLVFVVNHSGGRDSALMFGFVRRRFSESATYAVMADTGFEHQKPISAAEFARERCAEFGFELTLVQSKAHLSRNDRAARDVSVCEIPAMYLRFETRSDRRLRPQPASSGHRELHCLKKKLGFTMRAGASLMQIVESHVSTPVEMERQ